MSQIFDEAFTIVYEDDGRPVVVTQMGIGKVAVSYGHNPDDEHTTIEFAEKLGDAKEGPLGDEEIGDSMHILSFPNLASLKLFHQRIGDLIDRVSEV